MCTSLGIITTIIVIIITQQLTVRLNDILPFSNLKDEDNDGGGGIGVKNDGEVDLNLNLITKNITRTAKLTNNIRRPKV